MECPFRENHEDGSGRISFFVSPDKNAYHCFSCNEHGNLVNLLTTKFEVGYFDAMELVTISDFEKKDSPEFELNLSMRIIFLKSSSAISIFFIVTFHHKRPFQVLSIHRFS
jgi:hypothetical protein